MGQKRYSKQSKKEYGGVKDLVHYLNREFLHKHMQEGTSGLNPRSNKQTNKQHILGAKILDPPQH